MKGMSQALTLVVASTVLLMVAVSVVFLTSGSLGDFGKAITGGGCMQTAQQRCQVKNINNVSMPNACIDKNGQGDKQVIERLDSDEWEMEDGERRIICSEVN